jgi:hypothetical protein
LKSFRIEAQTQKPVPYKDLAGELDSVHIDYMAFKIKASTLEEATQNARLFLRQCLKDASDALVIIQVRE